MQESIQNYESVINNEFALLKDTPSNAIYETNKLTIVPRERSISNGKKTINLKPNEFRILYALIQNENIIHTRETLRKIMNPRTPYSDDNELNSYVSRLRKELRKLCEEEMIITYPLLGYQWKYPVKKFSREK